MDTDYKKTVQSSFDSANPLSKFLFTWVLPTFVTGFSKELTINDLNDVPKTHKSHYEEVKLQKKWESQISTGKIKGIQPSFWKALLSVHYISFFIYLAIISVDELFLRVMQPIYLRKLVKSFNDLEATKKDQAFYAGIVCLTSLGHNLLVHQCVYLMYRTGLSCRTATSSLLYRKALCLRSEERATGTLLNLLSNDMSRFDYQLIFIPYLIVGPLQLVIMIYILHDEMGVSAFVGAAFIFLILPTQVVNGRLAAKFRRSVANLTDERSEIMNEIVMSIRVIKMYAWEKPFSAVVSLIRKREVFELGKRAYLKGFFLSLYTFSAKLCAFFVILSYVLAGHQLTADKAFFCVGISLTIVESMILVFSTAVSGLGECLVSTQRIQKFLLLPEQRDNNGTSSSKQLIEAKGGNVNLKNVTAMWSGAEKNTLNDLNLSLKGDQLVMVVGQVGSGKSSLLQLLISEIKMLKGVFNISGTISYASQEPWIFPGNLRQNILFGEEFEVLKYDQVVTACALKDDFNQLPHGDMSIVGERGITLSGGQKARVNLARSLYRNVDIYLLDDPLSAVDTKVSRHIFDKCVQGRLKGKLRILVTHQLQYLSRADYVVVLNNGSIHSQGTYENLIKSGVDFMSLISDKNEIERRNSRQSISEEIEKPLVDYDKPDDNIEKMAQGSVSIETYWNYIAAGSSYFRLFIVILFFMIGQFLLTACEYWLSYWTDSEELHNAKEAPGTNFTTILPSKSVVILDPKKYHGQDTYLLVYTGLVVALFIFTISKAFGFFSYCLKISNNLFNKMFKAVLRAPTKFYDDNSSGRIMNRLTKDIGSIDELLPASLYDTLEYTLQMLGVIAIIIISNLFFILPTIFIVFVFWGLRIIFVRTSRDVKRLESLWKSPVFTHVASSLQGLTTIRTLRAQPILIKQFDDKQDIHSSTWFAFISITRCFALWAETVGILFLTLITFSFLLFAEDSSAGMVGLVITSTLSLTVNIQWAIRQSAELENHMTSVERALEYTKLKPEAPLESSPDKKPSKDWPSQGNIKFQKLCLNYGDKQILKNLNFEILPREKIGIIGRTGAGKSSIISALFRLTEPQGKIIIDGVSISQIGLQDLRMSISIIPQEPQLFSGTIRYNLDPFNRFEDSELWNVLEEVQLKDVVSALDFQVSDGGSNFSLGQRQLVCLARAVLCRNKIIVLDEATANCDLKTDEFIQKTIRQKFADCTIITIAHRLHSVMDSDRILVLEAGEIMEYDHPHILLQKSEGIFTLMASHTGKSSFEMLKQMAKRHYQQKKR